MARERADRDANRVPVGLVVTNDSDLFPTQLRCDAATYRLLVNATITDEVDIGKLDQASTSELVSLSTTRQQIAFSGGDITIPASVRAVEVQNDSSNILYIGGSSVASDGTDAGRAMRHQGDSYIFNNIDTDWSVYIVASAASTDIRILYL